MSSTEEIDTLSPTSTAAQALEQLKPELKGYLESRVDVWYTLHDQNLNAYSRNLNAALDRVKKRIENEETLADVWQELLKYSKSLGKWCQNIEYVSEELSAVQFFGDFMKKSPSFLAALPPKTAFEPPLPDRKWWNPFDKSVINDFPLHSFIRYYLFHDFK